MSDRDPKGYYSVLGVPYTADFSQIKAAYRSRAKDLHPDQNPDANAAAGFGLLNEAYTQLSDPESRALYDTVSLETPRATQAAAVEPIVCSRCGQVTAQPRYAIFFTVSSFLIGTIRSPVQAILCSGCAEKEAYRATAITWVTGWWGFPWGPIYSVQAIFTNMMGGKKLADVNSRIMAHQAWYFASRGKMEIAQAVAVEASELARTVPLEAGGDQIRSNVDDLVSIVGDSGRRLKNPWRILSRPFYVQASIVGAAVLAGWLAYQHISASQPVRGPKPYLATGPAGKSVPAPEPIRYVRPVRAPNGAAWPSGAAYVPGYPLLKNKGHSSVTIDNSGGKSDVFAKLVSLDGPNEFPARVFYIPAGRSYTLKNVGEGSYDVRYQRLSSGVLSRSEPFSLIEKRTNDGIEYSTLKLTLFRVPYGNSKAYPLAEADF